MTSKWNLCWLLPWMIVTWGAVELLVFLPLFLLGLIAFPIAEAWAPIVTTDSRVWGRHIVAFKWPWLNTWLGNNEDGLSPIINGKAYDPYLWFIRNPISNMRFWPIISIKPKPILALCNPPWKLPAPIYVLGNAPEIVETPGWFVCCCGWRVGARWIWENPIMTIKGLAIGWHLNPRDAKYIPPSDARREGIGVVCQILRA